MRKKPTQNETKWNAMSTVARKFILPSTLDERRKLISEITSWCAERLGSLVRQANVERWQQMEMPELRRVHDNWHKLMRSTKLQTRRDP